jgi:hypothetical protein
MTQLNDLPQGGQAHDAWAKPARSKTERRAHVLRMLESENKLWIATASADGSAHLVPFSFVWDGERVSMATRKDSPTAQNAARTGKARLALGNFGDVVLIDGPVCVPAADPWRIQAWWSGSELGNPTIMRDGRWLTA